ncbi:DUF5682 family protein [Oryzibacter oryziterrae]|uniref:DUF5682 family protein n=1 Tax=Oryzibacter oryziterrae TaxID=2766474 RepID=UPI001F38F0A9|nr:DUF5682 family protein [Oryzibacter oryziterrae]
MDDRLHLLGIRHHGPGSAALTVAALDRLDPAAVLIEGAPEGEALVRHVGDAGLKPPVALLFYVVDDAKAAVFAPFAEFSPEWQAIRWAVAHGRPVVFIDWPATISLAWKPGEDTELALRPDPLDLIARTAGAEDGEAFWNALIEESGGLGDPLATFAAIGDTMAEARASAESDGLAIGRRDEIREAFMRLATRQALKDHSGTLAAVVGAWHVPALRQKLPIAEDKATIRDLAKLKVEATWVPWTDSRLASASGYGAGVISPGWYRHLWQAHSAKRQDPATFAATWQARTASLLRSAGLAASSAAAIEAARLSLALCQLRDLAMPGLAEMREGALAALCHGDEIPLRLIERRLYVGEMIGEIGENIPQMPLARDLALWQRRARLKPEDLETDIRLDLRSEAGLLKSTLLHRLMLLNVPWGHLIEANAGRGTFREVWRLSWQPEFSVALADCLVYGITIEEAAGNLVRERAKAATGIGELAKLVGAALVADLPDPATDAIASLQALAVNASDLTDLMKAVVPLASVLRYGTARKLPEEALRALITALVIEVNAGIRIGSHQLEADVADARVAAMRAFDEALGLIGEDELIVFWRRQLLLIVEDDQAAAPVAGFALRRSADAGCLDAEAVATAFSLHMNAAPRTAGAFLEAFLAGGAEILIQDPAILSLIDLWLMALDEDGFMEVLPLLRRAFSGFDTVTRKRLLTVVAKGPMTSSVAQPMAVEAGENAAFMAALPLLLRILGLEAAS